ncbi:MAG: serine dehydratase subunit alpha family protein [Gammaproteobacteria bacterium]|nr:serine dehydratase subunit alpha family protein [Gammaproteobacteria bacterium]
MRTIFNESTILNIVQNITFKTIGCTEPTAIALAAVTAYQQIKGEIKSVQVTLDKNVYKNAMSVGIPGTDEKGPKMAIALGLVCGNSDDHFLLLKNVSEQNIIQAKQLLDRNCIQIHLNKTAYSLCILAEIETSNGNAKAFISKNHDNITLVEKNGQTIYQKPDDTKNESCWLDQYNFSNLNLDDLIDIIPTIPEHKIVFLLEGFELNKRAAEIGLEKSPGMGLGATQKRWIEEKTIDNNCMNNIKMMVSAAADTRMGGIKTPIWGCSGSGNHGILFFLTIGLYFERFPIKRSISLAHTYTFGLIILAAIKQVLGLLSPVCGGALAAGAAASAAITYALGGNSLQITQAINLVFGNIAGIICDGAKYGCSLKLNTGAACAVESALLALRNTDATKIDGIVGKNFHHTLSNIGYLSKKGMSQVDETLLEILGGIT